MNQTKNKFPPGIVWGAGTAANQIESAWDKDGIGKNIWDRFINSPSNFFNVDNKDIACDHYQRWREDINLMEACGLDAFRFSLSWSRLLPQGHGQVNTEEFSS